MPIPRCVLKQAAKISGRNGTLTSLLVGVALAQITASAAHYDLRKTGERQRSARNLKQLFFGLQRVLKPDVFVEAGANDAQTSIDIRKLVPGTAITAFEANPFNHENFSKLIDYTAHNIDYLNMALSDEVGTISFKILRKVGEQIIDPISERNSILARAEPDVVYDDVTVRSTTLDEYFNAQEGSFGLWVDVEGASRQVLTGADQTLAKTQSLIVEVESKSYWSEQWLYHDVCSHLMTKGFVPVARDYEYKQQFNIVFVRSDLFASPDVIKELEYYQSALVGVGRHR